MEQLFILNTFKTNTPAGQSVARVRYVLAMLLGLAAMFHTGLASGQSTWMGMKFTTGSTPISINALGRVYAPDNNQTHQIKLITANDGKDVSGGSVNLSMAGGTVGEFKYAALGSTLTLSPNTAYFLVSRETEGGDSWYGADSKVTTTNAAVCQGGVYWDGDSWVTVGGQGNALVPVNFTYLPNGPEEPEVPSDPSAGINYSYYEGDWTNLPNFGSMTAVEKGQVDNFSLAPRNRNENFGFRFTGYIQIPANGTYTFYTSSDDGSKLYIGTTEVVDNDGLHSNQERSGNITLNAGKYPITVTFFENLGDAILAVSWSGPGIAKQAIPNSVLTRDGKGSIDPTDGPDPVPSPSPNPAPSNSVFYRGINLNGSAITIDGNQWAGSNAPDYSYSGYTFTDNNVTLKPATDANRAAMIRSSIYSNDLKVKLSSVPSGTYQVYLYVWEDNESQTYTVHLDGKPVKQNHSSGTTGAWAKLGPYSTTVSDGTLEVTTTGGHANLSGIEVWKSTATTPAPNPGDPETDAFAGSYKIIARHSGKGLDVDNASYANGANVSQWEYSGGNNQIWQVASTGDGYYKITAKHSGKALEVAGSSTGNGANVQQNAYSGGANQQWKIESVGNGYYKITAKHSGKVLDVNGIATNNGAEIVQWDYSNGAHQQWKLESASGAETPGSSTPDPVTEQMGLPLTLYPNPANDQVSLTMNAQYYGEGKLTITDGTGQVKISHKVGVAPGKNTFVVHTGSLATGVYFVKLQADGKEGNEKLVIAQ